MNYETIMLDLSNIYFMKHLLTFFSVLLFANLQAQIITDRPDQTESSSVIGSGNFQIESGFLLETDHNNNKNILLPTNLLRFGLSDQLELRLVNEFSMVAEEQETTFSGMNDLQIGVKLSLTNDESKSTQIAILDHLIVPSGSNNLTDNSYGISHKFSVSHEVPNFDLGYNIGYDYFEGGSDALTYSLALGKAIHEKMSVYIEPYGSWENLETFQLNADSGFTYLMKENLQADFSFGLGLNHRMNYSSIGISWLNLRN